MYFILLVSYLIGSIPFALVVGKGIYGVDVREHGSGNLGATNTFRTLGKTAGLLAAFGDILKGTLAASLPFIFGLDIHPLYAGLAAILGHSFPVFAKFKGGKAVATTAGVILAVAPIVFGITLLCFFLFLKLTKFVSASSILSALVVVIGSYITRDQPLLIFSIVIFLFITYKHRANISRILHKEEPKVTWL